jgi:hypothetical protein
VADPPGITFAENGEVDVFALNALYRLIGWDRGGRRTAPETAEMLRVSRNQIAAHTADGTTPGLAPCHERFGFQPLKEAACVWTATIHSPHAPV